MEENYDNNPAIVGLARRTMGLVRFIYELPLKERPGTIKIRSEGYDDYLKIEKPEYIAYLYSVEGREYKLVIYLLAGQDKRITITPSPIRILYQVKDGWLWDEVEVDKDVLKHVHKIMLYNAIGKRC